MMEFMARTDKGVWFKIDKHNHLVVIEDGDTIEIQVPMDYEAQIRRKGNTVRLTRKKDDGQTNKT